MTRTMKPETQIKNIMNTLIENNGVKNTDLVNTAGQRFILVVPNRFGQGYVRYITSTGDIWTADLKRNDPTKVTCVKLVKLSSEDEIEAKKQHLASLRNLLQENFKTMSLDELVEARCTIGLLFDWLYEQGVEVE